MRKALLILPALFFFTAATAQIRVDESVCLGYNRSFGMYQDDATMVSWLLGDRLDLRGGLRLHSRLTAIELGSKYYLSDSFGIEGLYIGQRSKELDFREYNIGLLGLWRWKDRVEVKAGTFFRKFTPLKGQGSVSEPFNFAYSISFWALDTGRRFNIGASLSNLDMFTAERFYCPLLTIKARYSINRRIMLYAQFRQHNSGTFDLTSNLFDRQFRLGTILSW